PAAVAPLAAPGLAPAVAALAESAAKNAVARGLAESPRTLTVIDYSLPSTEKRLWVFDLETRGLLFHELVAHGKNTGDNLATRFSNTLDSKQTSLGLFRTANTYVGSNGYSLRLHGLDRGFNDRAFDRAIVIHGAPYVSEDFARAQGRIGRSWGCPALDDDVSREVIDTIAGGDLVFAFYPQPEFLRGSELLAGTAEAESLLVKTAGSAIAAAAR
ncbi:MAG TPA: murein L,D-transpeptidase catalytic domain family protein, partial [Thermoanaerobaculia bacterium]|nr:murein L,D-transpeptidase catalytic domain family protein [Thermoanaerobaculia bacterium]